MGEGSSLATLIMFIIFCILLTTVSITISIFLRKKFPEKKYDRIFDYTLLIAGLVIIAIQYGEHYWTRTSLVFITFLTLLWVGVAYMVYFLSKLNTTKKVDKDNF